MKPFKAIPMEALDYFLDNPPDGMCSFLLDWEPLCEPGKSIEIFTFDPGEPFAPFKRTERFL